MAKKELTYRGLLENEVKDLSLQDFMKLVNARERRSLKRGFTHQQKVLLDKINKGKNNVKTHARSMIIVPQMLGKTIKVYTGKEYIDVPIDLEKMGKRVGEFALTRKVVKHSSAGVGASKSSKGQARK